MALKIIKGVATQLCRNAPLHNNHPDAGMKICLCTYFRCLLLSSFGLSMLASCAYQRPAGHWQVIDATTIYFPVLELDENAIDPNYEAVCKEARHEIQTQLIRRLPAKITPLGLETDKTASRISATAVTLKIRIDQCEIDVDQAGGTFSYYLTLPLTVSLTQNGKSLLDYNMNTYEQISIDNPSPAFEFTFAEPVSRTLLLFKGISINS